MNLSSRKLITNLLLALLLCHAGLNAHGATHTSVDSSKCEICASFSDSPIVNDINDVAIEALPELLQFREVPPGPANDCASLTPPVRGPPSIA